MHDYKNLKSDSVYIGAGSFEDYGTWVLDTQFITNMGSAYLLAHGLGEPVEDALTSVTLPDAGEYNIWVRTKNWVGYWKKDMAPGIFNVCINGVPTGVELGSGKPDWHWQNAGKFKADDTNVSLSLNDLTGFEGRCAGVLITKDMDFTPPRRYERDNFSYRSPDGKRYSGGLRLI